jgi:hypothetical protein
MLRREIAAGLAAGVLLCAPASYKPGPSHRGEVTKGAPLNAYVV